MYTRQSNIDTARIRYTTVNDQERTALIRSVRWITRTKGILWHIGYRIRLVNIIQFHIIILVGWIKQIKKR